MSAELTVIYYTANLINDRFAQNVRRELSRAIGELPLISLSKKPINFGQNIVDELPERSITNVYKALLNGAKTAKTKYIALAEDDTLYPDEHFQAYLPGKDTFAYNMTRWNIYTWSKPPFFSLQPRRILASLIAPRELFIEAIEERFAKHPQRIPEKWMGEPGRGKYEGRLGVTMRNSEEFFTYNPLVVFSHPESMGYQTTGPRKRAGKIRATAIPYWGTSEHVRAMYGDV